MNIAIITTVKFVKLFSHCLLYSYMLILNIAETRYNTYYFSNC
jgi:hypothetical protein